MNIKNIVGINLKKIRLKNNISRSALAAQLGKTAACISNIEAGIRSPSLPLLFELTTFFQEDIRSFLSLNTIETTTVIDWKENWPLVGKNIACTRKSLGIRQYRLARQLNITIAFLCNLENGKCICSLPMLERIAQSLGVDICDLFMIE